MKVYHHQSVPLFSLLLVFPITSLASAALRASTADDPSPHGGRSAFSSWKCVNDAEHGGVDAGCSQEFPICANSQTGQETTFEQAGDQCVVCLQATRGAIDIGCHEEAPHCRTTPPADASVADVWTLVGGGRQCCAATGDCPLQQQDNEQSTPCGALAVGSGYCLDRRARHYPYCAYDGFVCPELAKLDYAVLGWEQYHGSRATGALPECNLLYSSSYVAGKAVDEVCPMLDAYIGHNFDSKGQGTVQKSSVETVATCYACARNMAVE